MFAARGAPIPARLLLLAAAAFPAAARAAADAPTAIVVTAARPAEPGTSDTVDDERLRETTDLVDPEDSLRYLPSLLVRKRHIGDTQSPLATRTSGVGASARSLVYVDGILLSALIGNNNNFASPRWGIVSPEEIERVTLLYGPFSARFPGNSIGAVVEIATRLPDRAEFSLHAGTSIQGFDQYGMNAVFPAYDLAATAGDRTGPFAFFLSAHHLASRAQPLAYATVARPAAASSAGLPATGAFPAVDRTDTPDFVIGAAGIEAQIQDTLGAKLAYDLVPDLRLSWRGALFLNRTDASAQSGLSGPDGAVYAGALNLDGRAVTVPASAFSNNVYRLRERHWMQALSAEGGKAGGFTWRALASLYRYARDDQAIPGTALPAAETGGAGSILKMGGTGWDTLDLEAGRGGFSAGAHGDLFRLESDLYATADWLRAGPGALSRASRGRTRAAALWAEDRIGLARGLDLTLGARQEWWRADQGFNFSLSPALSVHQPVLDRSGLSPKAALRWTPASRWSVTLATGQAWRFPTVSELYQAITTGPSITVPDPRLRPERARSEELAIQYSDPLGHIRLSLFNESIRDALIAQTAPLAPGSTTLFSFVQNIPQTHAKGIELGFDRRDLLVPGLELQGSVTLTDPKVIRDPAFAFAQGKDLPQVPRRRATLVATWHAGRGASFTLAGRYSSRSFGTIDNSDPVGHAFQGFDRYLVIDMRADFRIGRHWEAAVGVENLGNDKYFLFHPFPQRSFTASLDYRW